MSGDPLRDRYDASIEALNRGDWRQAQSLAMSLVRDAPPHGGVFFVAGVAARELRDVPLAIQCLENAVRLTPTRADYLAQLARAWAQASEPGRATELANRALAMAGDGGDAATYDALGLVYTQAHAYDRAAAMFGRVAGLQPDSARHQYNHATAMIHAGDVAGASRALAACLAADPGYWKAWLSRSQLEKATAARNHLDELRGVLATAPPDVLPQLCLHMALSKELEDLGDYPAAFHHLVEGKAWGRKAHAYDPATDVALFDAIIRHAPVAVPASQGFATDVPIFVIGLPRTGTTLVERVLSSHSQVHAAGELHNFGVALKRASGSRTPPMLDVDTVERSTALDWRALGERYLASTRPGTLATPRFIDKLPHNFLYAGHIAAALPQARIVCLRRGAMDSCLSNFRQLFALTSSYYDYSFDLRDTGRYYLLFDRLMAHWRAAMPGRILEVGYEDMVDDLEGGARRLLDFCGLPWEDACLRFDENAAPVATASALQVRSPIYRSAIGRWKRYAAELEPLQALLREGGVAVDD